MCHRLRSFFWILPQGGYHARSFLLYQLHTTQYHTDKNTQVLPRITANSRHPSFLPFSESESLEVKAFVQHIVSHLDLRLRLFKFADPKSASLSRAVSKAATSLATGEHLLIMNCDVILQTGALRAMVHAKLIFCLSVCMPSFLPTLAYIFPSFD